MEALCLACSSSLPPNARESAIFITTCCGLPICPNCLTSNPRLARYNPCLACLGGVQAVSASSFQSRRASKDLITMNIDGAMRDEDTYVIGDDDDEDPPQDISPPPYQASQDEVEAVAEEPRIKSTTPLYHIKRGDTLRGISFKLGIDAWELCTINKLPFSTLNTTPHLLHTRTSLVLPSSMQLELAAPSEGTAASGDQEWRNRRARERATKRFQTLTKEVDWHVAKAYVALADDPDVALLQAAKAKETGSKLSGNLESMAVSQYLDDDEWEQNEGGSGQHRPSASKPGYMKWRIFKS